MRAIAPTTLPPATRMRRSRPCDGTSSWTSAPCVRNHGPTRATARAGGTELVVAADDVAAPTPEARLHDHRTGTTPEGPSGWSTLRSRMREPGSAEEPGGEELVVRASSALAGLQHPDAPASREPSAQRPSSTRRASSGHRAGRARCHRGRAPGARAPGRAVGLEPGRGCRDERPVRLRLAARDQGQLHGCYVPAAAASGKGSRQVQAGRSPVRHRVSRQAPATAGWGGGVARRRVSHRRARNAALAITPARTKTIASPAGSRVTTSMTAPTAAAHGIVITQATRMLPATPSARPRGAVPSPRP